MAGHCRFYTMQKSELAAALRERLSTPYELERLKATLFANSSADEVDVEDLNALTLDEHIACLDKMPDDEVISYYVHRENGCSSLPLAHLERMVELASTIDEFVGYYSSQATAAVVFEKSFEYLYDAGRRWHRTAKKSHRRAAKVAFERVDMDALLAVPGVAPILEGALSGMEAFTLRDCQEHGLDDADIQRTVQIMLGPLRLLGPVVIWGGAFGRDRDWVVGEAMERTHSGMVLR